MAKSWLFALHQGPGGSSQLLYQVHNPTTWSGDLPVANTGGLTDSPGAVQFIDRNLYAFYQRNHLFLYNVYDGALWLGETQVPNTAGCDAGVAAIIYGPSIYLFYANPNSGFLMYRTFDGKNFGSEQLVLSTQTYSVVGTPAAAVFKNELRVFCHGPDNSFWHANFDGKFWSEALPMPGTAGVSNSPGATVFNGALYTFHNTPTGQFSFKTYGDRGWTGDIPIPNTGGCVGNPGAAAYAGVIYLLYQGPSGAFYYRTFDGTNWTPETRVPMTGGISAGPAVAVYTL